VKQLHRAMLSAALCLVVAGSSQADVCNLFFKPATSTALGYRPNRVVLADLNHDGILDAVLPMRDQGGGPPWGSTVAVMLGGGSGGVGDGTFGPPTSFATGSGPQGVAAADLDGDGNIDLAVANGQSNTISILHGLGDGTFAAPVNLPDGAGPYGIAVADVNLDNVPDLVVADNSAASVSVLLGQGGGAFAAAVVYPVADYSLSLAVADINHDNKPDIVATAYNQGMAVLLGNGNGTFQAAVPYGTNGQPYTVALADVDGDGNLDMLAGNQSLGGLAVLRGTGTGTFNSPAFYGVGQWTVAGIAIADVDADGIADLLLTNASTNVVLFLRGQGSGGVGNGQFALHSSYSAPSFPVGIATGQLNGDGLPDVVVAGYTSSTEVTLLGTCIMYAPHLEPVRDVPNDNGGRVFVTWTPSAFDVPGGSVNQYRVWRRIPPGAAQAAQAVEAAEAAASPSNGRPLVIHTLGLDGTTTVFWEALATLPAQRLEGYGYTAATTQDSIADSNPYTAFFVSALTSNIDVFYSSNIDSGYSVDNLRPHKPSGLVASRSGDGVGLHWDENGDADFATYHLYRGATADFAISEQSRIAVLTQALYLDAGAQGDQYYKLTAIDVHGNESDEAILPPVAPVGVDDIPMAPFDLRGAVPNPSRTGVLAIHASVPTGSSARLEVLDLAGRRVAERTLQAPGAQVIRVGDRSPLPAGVYMIRLTMGAVRRDMKAIVMR